MDGVEGVDYWGVRAQKAGARCTRLSRAPGLGPSRAEDAFRSVSAALASRLAEEVLFGGVLLRDSAHGRYPHVGGGTSEGRVNQGPAGSAATLTQLPWHL